MAWHHTILEAVFARAGRGEADIHNSSGTKSTAAVHCFAVADISSSW